MESKAYLMHNLTNAQDVVYYVFARIEDIVFLHASDDYKALTAQTALRDSNHNRERNAQITTPRRPHREGGVPGHLFSEVSPKQQRAAGSRAPEPMTVMSAWRRRMAIQPRRLDVHARYSITSSTRRIAKFSS